MKTDFQLKVAVGWEQTEVIVLRKGKKILCRRLTYTGKQLADFLQDRLKLSRTEALNVLGEQGYYPSVPPLSLKERVKKMAPFCSVLPDWLETAAAQAETVWNSLPFRGEPVEKHIKTPFSKCWPLEGWSVMDGFAGPDEQEPETPLKYVSVLGSAGKPLLPSVGNLWNISLAVKDGKTETVVLKGKEFSNEINFLAESFSRCGLTVSFQESNLPENHIAAEVSGPSAKEKSPRLEAVLFIVKQVATGLDFYVGFPAYQASAAVKPKHPKRERVEPCLAPRQTAGQASGVPFVQTVAPREIEKGFYEVTEGVSPQAHPSFLPSVCVPGYILKLKKNQNSFIRAAGASKTGCMVVFPVGQIPCASKLKKAVSAVVAEWGKSFAGYYAFNGRVIFSRNSFTADFPDETLKCVRREAAVLQRELGISTVLIKEFETGRIFVLEKESADCTNP